MRLRTSNAIQSGRAGSTPGGNSAFTLLELLVVLAIMALLAAVTLPAMKGMRQTNALASANRQLLDDLGAARQRAIKDGTIVMVLFSPPAEATVDPFANVAPAPPAEEIQKRKNILLRNQLTSYALFAERTAGDQPGRRRPRYLAFGGEVWRTLPDGLFIPIWKFDKGTNATVFRNLFGTDYIPPFDYIDGVPVPTVVHGTDRVTVPYVAFNAKGQLVRWVQDPANPNSLKLEEPSAVDAVIPLARGSIFLARKTDTSLAWDAPDVVERPPGNSVENYNLIIIDKLTGRARIESPQIQ